MPDQESDDDELHEQLPACRDVAPVIDDAHDGHDGPPGQQHEHLLIQDHVRKEGRVEGKDDGKPAQKRRFFLVDLPPPGNVDDVEPDGHPHDERGERPRKTAGQQQDVEPAFADLEEEGTERGDEEQARRDRCDKPEDPSRENLPDRRTKQIHFINPE